MSTRTLVECDICGIQKKQVNHWWCVAIEAEIFRCWPAEKNFERGPNVRDVCGKAHVFEMFNRYIETGQLDKTGSTTTTLDNENKRENE